MLLEVKTLIILVRCGLQKFLSRWEHEGKILNNILFCDLGDGYTVAFSMEKNDEATSLIVCVWNTNTILEVKKC